MFQAKEGIEQLVYLCRTDKDEVRDAAKQALLVLGMIIILLLTTINFLFNVRVKKSKNIIVELFSFFYVFILPSLCCHIYVIYDGHISCQFVISFIRLISTVHHFHCDIQKDCES